MDGAEITSFNAAEWVDQLLALNEWAHEITICEEDTRFRPARIAACLHRYAKGRSGWNAWAVEMHVSRKKLEDAGIWFTIGVRDEKLELNRELGQNDETQKWLALAMADFTDFVFEPPGDFKGFIFPGEANFTGVRFQQAADFRTSQFYSLARFDRAKFKGDAWFRQVQFAVVAFRDAEFSGTSSFSAAVFPGSAWFNRAQFESTGFRSAKFLIFADFTDVKFNKNTSFSDGARFDRVKFVGTEFHGKAWFNQTNFAGNAWFSNAHFYRGFYPPDPTRPKALNEDLAPDFSGMAADRAFSLDGAIFDVLPNFTQSSFSEAPRLDNLVFGKTVEPGGFWQSFRPAEPRVAARYRALKGLAIQGHDHERERQFFKGELRSRRNTEDRWWHASFIFGILYDLVSDFGGSVWRPLLLWAGVLGLFAWVYLRLATSVGVCDHAVNALQLSFRNALIIVGGGRDPGPIYMCLFGSPNPGTVYFIELVQMLLSGILIFLVLLALRNRFRIH